MFGFCLRLECTKMFGLTQIGVYKDVWFDSDWSVQRCLV